MAREELSSGVKRWLIKVVTVDSTVAVSHLQGRRLQPHDGKVTGPRQAPHARGGVRRPPLAPLAHRPRHRIRRPQHLGASRGGQEGVRRGAGGASRGGGKESGREGKDRSSVDTREPQNPTESEEHQRHLQGVLYIV
eukprot:1175452-Prorocentrum_minimum.AAC.1